MHCKKSPRLRGAVATLGFAAAAAGLAACDEGGASGIREDCVADGSFRAELYGDLDGRVDWTDEALACEGMPRPHGAGARLRFSGPAGERRLAVIVALPELERGQTARELKATVTLIEEENGRFYSNGDAEHCWSDVTRQEALADGSERFRVQGIVYCMAPLAEQAGNGRVTLGETRFSGVVDWRSPD